MALQKNIEGKGAEEKWPQMEMWIYTKDVWVSKLAELLSQPTAVLRLKDSKKYETDIRVLWFIEGSNLLKLDTM